MRKFLTKIEYDSPLTQLEIEQIYGIEAFNKCRGCGWELGPCFCFNAPSDSNDKPKNGRHLVSQK